MVHLSRYVPRLNRKILSCEPYCLNPEPLFPNALLFAEGDRKIVLASVKIRVTWVFVSPALLGTKTNQGHRADSLSSALAPWTRWFISACLSPCRLWTQLCTWTHSVSCSFLLCGLPPWMPCTRGLLPTSRTPWVLDLAL